MYEYQQVSFVALPKTQNKSFKISSLTSLYANTALLLKNLPKLNKYCFLKACTSTSQATHEFVNRQGHMIPCTFGRLQKLKEMSILHVCMHVHCIRVIYMDS